MDPAEGVIGKGQPTRDGPPDEDARRGQRDGPPCVRAADDGELEERRTGRDPRRRIVDELHRNALHRRDRRPVQERWPSDHGRRRDRGAPHGQRVDLCSQGDSQGADELCRLVVAGPAHDDVDRIGSATRQVDGEGQLHACTP